VQHACHPRWGTLLAVHRVCEQLGPLGDHAAQAAEQGRPTAVSTSAADAGGTTPIASRRLLAAS
jgi:hypothetical protein